MHYNFNLWFFLIGFFTSFIIFNIEIETIDDEEDDKDEDDSKKENKKNS